MKGVHIKMMINGINDMNRNLSVNVTGVDTQDISPARLKAMKRSGQVECETCANRKAASKDGEVLNATVTLKTAVCPECGRSYVSGGVTNTAIKYPVTSYGQNQKSADYPELSGKNVDYAG